MKKIYFAAGFPRSGSTLLANLLNQNPEIYSEHSDTLCIGVDSAWRGFSTSVITSSYAALGIKNSIAGMINNYYVDIEKPYVISNCHAWIEKFNLLKALYPDLKMIITVRQPYEILASFENLRLSNPLECRFEETQRSNSSIGSRAVYFSSENGPLGRSFVALNDIITQGFKSHLLLVDYKKLCIDPEYQLKRIYNFLKLDIFKHDLSSINQERVIYNTPAMESLGFYYKDMHQIKNTLQLSEHDCERILGKDIVKQYSTNVWEDLT